MRWHPLAPAEPGMGDYQANALQQRGDHSLFTAASQHGGVNQPGLSMQYLLLPSKEKRKMERTETGWAENWREVASAEKARK